MVKDTYHYIEIIANECKKLVSFNNKLHHKQKVDREELIRTLKNIKNGINSYEESLKQVYQDEEKAKIPVVDGKVNELISEYKLLDGGAKEMWRIAQVIEHNKMIPPAEVPKLQEVFTAVITHLDKVADLEINILDLIRKDEKELHKMKTDIGNKHKGIKALRFLKRSV